MPLIITIGLFAAACATNVGGSAAGSDAGDTGNGNGASGGSPGTSYAWVAGTFGACSSVCGGGVQERSVACIASDGSVAPDSACTSPEPDAMQACNAQSCTNTSCTPALNLVEPTLMKAISPTDGPGPFTVTLDISILSNFIYDRIDFGDGTMYSGPLTFVNISANDGNGNDEGAFACVSHTYTAPGTYPIGRSNGDVPPSFIELTATVE